MIQKITLGIAVLALIVGGVAISRGDSSVLGGNTSYQKQSFVEGFWAGSGRQLEVDRTGALSTSADVVFSGGTLNVSTSNTATSTVIGGCFQFYATSTATAQRFQASTTPGIMFSSYGACPNL